MRKSTIFLMALALALILPLEQTVVATPDLPLRRSRFLVSPAPSFYDCSKQKQACPGGPGAMCCHGRCVDTESSLLHCGTCDNPCQFGQTCCKRNCVNTLADKKNCGGCGVKCRTKCTNGYCDYAV